MTAPIFETTDDKLDERAARICVQAHLGPEYEVLPRVERSHADWDIWKGGKVVQLCEYKGRNGKSDEYDDAGGIILSVRKLKWLEGEAAACECPVVIFFGFTDGLFYINLKDVPREISMFSRSLEREGNAHDIEAVVYIKSEMLTKLEVKHEQNT